MRPIDADAFKEFISKGYEEFKSEFKTDKYRKIAEEVAKGFIMAIDEQPTVYCEVESPCKKRLLDDEHVNLFVVTMTQEEQLEICTALRKWI
jgi:hypothetical protein